MSSAELVTWAWDCSARLLKPLGRRFLHVQAVGKLAERVAGAFGDEGDTLVAAALLHYIGYAPSLAYTGFHPLDGARFVRGQGNERLARLVAHHSGAGVEAQLRGFDGYLAEFTYGGSPLDEALTYCDLTTGPSGASVTLDERVQEIQSRYGPDHVVTRSITAGWPEFRRAVHNTERRMVEAGLLLPR